MTKKRNILIKIEGAPRSGKSYIAKMIRNLLQQCGYDAFSLSDKSSQQALEKTRERHDYTIIENYGGRDEPLKKFNIEELKHQFELVYYKEECDNGHNQSQSYLNFDRDKNDNYTDKETLLLWIGFYKCASINGLLRFYGDGGQEQFITKMCPECYCFTVPDMEDCPYCG